MPDCLLPLVALTAEGSECFPVLPIYPLDYLESTEGLYLDAGHGLSIKGISLEPEQFYKKLNAARAIALAETRSAISKALLQRLQPAVPWRGQLGKTSTSGVALPGTQAKMQLDTHERPGMALRILRVELLTDQPVTTEITLLLDGVDVSTEANCAALFIPLDGQTHTLTVELPTAVRPRTTTLACGSCGSAAPLQPFLRNATGSVTGLSVQATVECQEDVLCEAAAYGGTARRDLGMAIYWKALETFAIDMLANGDHQGATQAGGLGVDDWKFLIDRYAAKFKEVIDYLALPEGGLGAEKSPCYICSTSRGPAMVKSYGGNPWT